MNLIYIFMLEHPVIYSIVIFALSGFFWAFIIWLCHRASDHECRIEQHLMDLDEFEKELK